MKDLKSFGPFVLDPERRLLLRDGEPVTLTPKMFDTLAVLVRERQRVVEKAELMELVWPDAVVEENNLTQQISGLRKALGDRADEGRYIRTVAGRGYRFVADVREPDAPAAASPLPPARPRLVAVLAVVAGVLVIAGAALLFVRFPHRVRSIAVLPFRSLGAQDDAYLGLGLTDVLITRLSNVRGVTIRPTSAVRRFEGKDVDPLAAGRELHVDSVLEGTIQRLGRQLRVTVRLWDVANAQPVWGATFDDDFTGLFAVEDSISQRMTSALALRLSDAERKRMTRRDTASAEAHRLYLKGVYFSRTRTAGGFEKARDAFNQAIAVDPTYALAYAGLADAYYRESSVHLSLAEATAKARAAAMTALQLDDSVAEAHAILGAIKFRYDWDFAGAEREFRRAIELNPSEPTARQWISELLTALGRADDAVAEARVAQQIDPLSPEVAWNLGFAELFGGRVDDAIRDLRASVASDPNFWLTRAFLAWAYAAKGDFARAWPEYRAALALDDNADVRSHLAWSYEKAGRHDDAVAVVRSITDRSGYVSPFFVAVAYLAAGDRGRGFEWLEKAYAERSEFLVFLKVAPNFDDVRADPRFVSMERRVGLVH